MHAAIAKAGFRSNGDVRSASRRPQTQARHPVPICARAMPVEADDGSADRSAPRGDAETEGRRAPGSNDVWLGGDMQRLRGRSAAVADERTVGREREVHWDLPVA